MQNPSSYYAVPKCDGSVWSGWQQSEPSGGSSRASSSSAMTLRNTLYPNPFEDPSNCSAIPISYTLTPPTPDSTDSDASSYSQLSMESIPEFDDMPEIPFVSAAVAYADDWIPSDRPAEPARNDDRCESSSFWSTLMRRTASKSSDASASTSTSSAILGQTSARDLAPSRTRKRSGSVTSIASSRTKPAPAKSILSSGDSVKTRRCKAPSVKFLDMPTIHYDDDEYLYDDADERSADPCMSPPPKKKAKGLGGLLSLRWLFGPSKVENRVTPSAPTGPVRPAISGPFPLWDSPPRRARGAGTGTSAASLRSVKSSASLRSVRSCGSRLPTYWPR
ncbi:uncharacterized protein TRAVEDRAFT_68647 [Trametes versicolor FP-101664 SS1]|uniref:uncharacterized protein n=1 Tax=Trametes versicolor (strain FP-101664) TaxID=717944 RepID=UPI0004623C33|nr:uncharacterized protein TRAVEDRAFT_68647 [Trametes versicolor FP-101664 SS1]EIW64989.1 hypothetical protein TRAVEDRAFT_68647 [Trametes versicolor FP-101664 SS1]